jgi:hypothetical protein
MHDSDTSAASASASLLSSVTQELKQLQLPLFTNALDCSSNRVALVMLLRSPHVERHAAALQTEVINAICLGAE